jgi:hypothetical protein
LLRCLVLFGLSLSSFSAFSIQACNGETTFVSDYYFPKGYDYLPKPTVLEACKTIEITANTYETFKITNVVALGTIRIGDPPFLVETYSCYGDFTFFDLATRKLETINGVGGGAFCGCKTTPTSLDFISCSSTSLSLTPVPQSPPDPRPKGTEGKDPKSSTHELIAKVMEGSAPKAGVAVSFKSNVLPLSGGHEHEGNRPEATVAPITGVTDANGQVKFKFIATEFAGEHVVTATCDSCSNKTADEVVTVLVPNLVQLGADYQSPARYILIGDTPKHPLNHFFTSEAKDALMGMMRLFKSADWGVVGVNDASLKWGGRFDIAGAWNGSHHEHLEGKEVDLSFVRPAGISSVLRQKVYDDANEAEGVSLPQILWHLKDNPKTGSKAHFHVYLLGQKASRTTPF